MKDNHLERFDEIAKQLCELHRKKDAAYGNSFGETFKKLGIISAATRLSDKFNRFINIITNKDIDTLGESSKDTLMDMAAYCIMTLVEMENWDNEVKKWGEKFESISHKEEYERFTHFVCQKNFRKFKKGLIYEVMDVDNNFINMTDGKSEMRIYKKDFENIFMKHE